MDVDEDELQDEFEKNIASSKSSSS